jgi:hypothetical protein
MQRETCRGDCGLGCRCGEGLACWLCFRLVGGWVRLVQGREGGLRLQLSCEEPSRPFHFCKHHRMGVLFGDFGRWEPHGASARGWLLGEFGRGANLNRLEPAYRELRIDGARRIHKAKAPSCRCALVKAGLDVGCLRGVEKCQIGAGQAANKEGQILVMAEAHTLRKRSSGHRRRI